MSLRSNENIIANIRSKKKSPLDTTALARYGTGRNVFSTNKANCCRERIISTFMPLSFRKQRVNGEKKYNPATSDR